MLVLTTWPSMENFEGNSGSNFFTLSGKFFEGIQGAGLS